MIFKLICHLRKIRLSFTFLEQIVGNFCLASYSFKKLSNFSLSKVLCLFQQSQNWNISKPPNAVFLSVLSVRSRVKFYWIGKGYAAQPCNGKEWNVLAVRTIAFFSCFIQKTFQRLSVVRAVSQPLDRICFSILPLTRDNVKVPDVKRNGDGYQFEPLQQIQIHLAIPMCQTQYIVMDASSNVCISYCWAQKLFGLSYA